MFPPPPGSIPNRPPDIPSPKVLGSAANLKRAGQRMKAAAPKLKQAAAGLRVVSEQMRPGGPVITQVQSVATGLTAIRFLLTYPKNALTAIAGFLDRIEVPTIEKQTGIVMGITVVTVLTIGSTKPLTGVAEECSKIADKISDIRSAIFTITNAIQSLVAQAPEIRNGLVQGADNLDAASADLDASGDALIEAGSAGV